MATLAELMKRGCHFCKCPLTDDTAVIGTISYGSVGEDGKWSTPTVVITCESCAEKHKTEE